MLLLDEPAAGLNEAERGELADMLLAVREQRELTYVVVEHSMAWVARLCDRAVVLSEGRTIFDGGLDALAHDPTVAAVLLQSRFEA